MQTMRAKKAGLDVFEVWRDIPGEEGRYQVSNQGRVRSVCRESIGKDGRAWSFTGQLLRPVPFNVTGHVSVALGHANNKKSVHYLVTLAFYGPRPEGTEVLHKNGDPADNRLVNLTYGTRQENIFDVYRHGGKLHKLDANDVREIRFLLNAGEKPAKIAEKFDVSATAIYNIKNGKTFSWLA